MLDRDSRNGQRALPGRAGLPSDAHPGGYLSHHYDDVGYGFHPSAAEVEEPFNPLKLLWYVVHYRWLIAIFVGVGLLIGGVATMMQTPKFSATARIEIMVPTARILEDMDVVAQSSDLRTFETAREKLKSRDLARRVVQQLNLANNADFLYPRADFAIGNIFSRVFGAPPVPWLPDTPIEEREARAVAMLLDSLSVSLVRGTSLLAVSSANANPQLAADIANQVVRSYMDQQVDRTMETSELARQFIEEQVTSLKQRLEASEAALVDYAKEQGLSAAGQDGALVTASITAMNTALATAIQERLATQRLIDQINAGSGDRLKEVLDSEPVQGAKARLGALESEYQQKLGMFKADFPEMQQLAARIAETKRQLQGEVDAIITSIQLRFEESVQEEMDLQAKLRELDAQQVEFQDKNIQYTILKREVESNRAQYQSLIDKLNSLGVASDLRGANVDVVDFAIRPSFPFEPSLFRNLLIFFGIATALSAATIYVLELLNNKFSVPDQVETELKLPVLGIIPRADGEKLSEALANPRSAISEAYRSLRTSLQFAGADGAPRTLLVTSSEPGESKSTSAFKLAEEFAAVGISVLIIDADLRRPSLHRAFRTENTMGLSNLLTGTVAQEDVQRMFHRTHQPNLVFLSTGPMVPNPADLLSSTRMGAIVHACLKTYGMVIIDGPPIIGLSDALILSRLAEATLLVVAAHQTARKAARAALKRLRMAGGHIVGAMLGKHDADKIEYSYAYRYMYDGYYSYGEDKPRITGEGSKDGRKLGGVAAMGHRIAHLYRLHVLPHLKRS
jgi:capsular exopolysaccharide synthesis family protein